LGSDIFGPPDNAVDLNINAAETMTGRLMLGVGVNSDAGLVGNFVYDEQNFDITRLPRSWEDFRTGTAWRGNGERLRIEANPGTVVQRYAVTYQIPYLNHTPINLTTSGFYFTRIYEDWDEGRVGGNVKLGYAFTPDFTGRIGFDGQRVDIYNPHKPTPIELAEAVGQNDRYGFSVGVAHDTRDSPFLPTQGHLLSVDFEQVVGTFIYPRVNVAARQYFLLRQRADQSGRHTLGIGADFGVTGSDTPIYDNYFAGGFSSLRGWAFRGASPRVDNVEVGGQLLAIGTAEYMFPITADDGLRGVVFCDFGTVERTIAFHSDQFRAAPGFGLRINVPAMGPAPIALDLAFPVASAPGDQIQNFSFSLGIAR
jgi:outer membrane protein insertion porin family